MENRDRSDAWFAGFFFELALLFCRGTQGPSTSRKNARFARDDRVWVVDREEVNVDEEV
jgi:hypothetical protein